VRDAIRLWAAGALLRLGRRDGRIVNRREPGGVDRSRELASALRTTGLRRVPADERSWIERIEARRDELATEQTTTDAVFSESPQEQPSRWGRLVRPVPVSTASRVISIPPLWGLLLMRLARELRPHSAIELGTGFGISAAYVTAALELDGRGRLTSFEGAERWAAIAQHGATDLGLHRLEIRLGALSQTLDSALPDLAPVDFAFVDAEHTKEATVRYFDTMLPHLSDGAVVVFDDIAFDKPMWEAWVEIREHRRVALALSLGKMGIVSVAARASGPARAR
jgi:predicted O-methyltransferase YrrM